MTRILANVLLAGLALAGTAQAQNCPTCPNGRCSPGYAPAYAVAAQAPPRVEWRTTQDSPGVAYLYLDGVQCGGYRQAFDEFRSYDPATRSWGPPQHLFPKLIPVSRGSVPLPE